MASLAQRIQAFLRSPAGRRVIDQGQRQLAKPENQQKLRRLVARLQGGRRR
jgi:predicted naringenin-chalcone synthase